MKCVWVEHCWIRISSFVVAYRPVSRIRRYDAMRSVYLYQTFAEIVVSLEMDHRYRLSCCCIRCGSSQRQEDPTPSLYFLRPMPRQRADFVRLEINCVVILGD